MGLWKKSADLCAVGNGEYEKAVAARKSGDMKAANRHEKAAEAFWSESDDVQAQAIRERNR